MATGGTAWGVATMFAPLAIGAFIFGAAVLQSSRTPEEDLIHREIEDRES